MDYKHWLREAYVEATHSPDKSTQNGALIINESSVLTRGCNRFPNGVEDKSERYDRPLKYKWTEHAERNVIYRAANLGFSTKDAIMVCPWAACSDCGRAIINSGIRQLVTHKQAHDRSPPFWAEEIEIAFTMLAEAGIEVVMFDGKVDGPEILHCGERWTP